MSPLVPKVLPVILLKVTNATAGGSISEKILGFNIPESHNDFVQKGWNCCLYLWVQIEMSTGRFMILEWWAKLPESGEEKLAAGMEHRRHSNLSPIRHGSYFHCTCLSGWNFRRQCGKNLDTKSWTLKRSFEQNYQAQPKPASLPFRAVGNIYIYIWCVPKLGNILRSPMWKKEFLQRLVR